MFGYSTGFALGIILGITVEQKFGSGYVQIYVVSMHYTDKIADALRNNKIGVTILPGEAEEEAWQYLFCSYREKGKWKQSIL